MTICSLFKRIRCYVKPVSWTERNATHNLMELSEKLADFGVFGQGETYTEINLWCLETVSEREPIFCLDQEMCRCFPELKYFRPS